MKLKLIILPLCFIVLQAFGFEGTIKQEVKNYNGTAETATMTWYLSPYHCRMDMVSRVDHTELNTVLILDPATGMLKTYTIGGTAGEKVYFEVNGSTISGSIPITSVNVTQEAKQINGYKCEKWLVATSTGVYNVWITRDIDFDWAPYKEFFKTGVEFQALILQGVKGFPMLTEPGTDGKNASTVQSVTVQPQGANTFTVPAEYKLFVPQPTAKTK